MSTKIGREGEEIAKKHLISQGYRLISQNFYSKFGEIDLIMKSPDGNTVFMEVKTYKKDALMDPRFSITPKKIKNLIRTAKYFIYRMNAENENFRFDLIIVPQESSTVPIEHLVDIFHVD